jgi:hypothetical protein
MKGFTAEEVIDLSDQFSSDYAANISNGLASIEFANCENQWDRTVVSERALDTISFRARVLSVFT